MKENSIYDIQEYKKYYIYISPYKNNRIPKHLLSTKFCLTAFLKSINMLIYHNLLLIIHHALKYVIKLCQFLLSENTLNLQCAWLLNFSIEVSAVL